MVSMACYLHQAPDEVIKAVARFQKAMTEERKPCLLEKAYAVMLRHGVTETLETARWPALRRQLQRAQEKGLIAKLKSKKLHGVFANQVEVEGYDLGMTWDQRTGGSRQLTSGLRRRR